MTSWCTGSPSVCRVWFAYPGTDTPDHHIYIEDFNLSLGAWENSEFGHPTADFTCHICDLTLVLQSTPGTPSGYTLRIPYSGGGPDILNVDNSKDGGQSWSNDQSDEAGSQWGAGAAVDGNNHFWISFPNYNSLNPEPLQIVQFQYN